MKLNLFILISFLTLITAMKNTVVVIYPDTLGLELVYDELQQGKHLGKFIFYSIKKKSISFEKKFDEILLCLV